MGFVDLGLLVLWSELAKGTMGKGGNDKPHQDKRSARLLLPSYRLDLRNIYMRLFSVRSLGRICSKDQGTISSLARGP